MIVCRHKVFSDACDYCNHRRLASLRSVVPVSQPPADAPATVLVGDVPPINAQPPTHKNALVTVVSGEKGRSLWGVTRGLMAAYADRHALDLIVLDWEGPPRWPMGSKFQIPNALGLYQRIIYVDADVVLRPSVPNLLDVVDPDAIGLWSDLPDVLVKDYAFVAEYLRFRKLVGLQHELPFRMEHYWNTGVMVISREHAHYFSVPTQPIPAWHCSEQHWWVSQLIDQQAPVQRMPREFNWQWWADPGFRLRQVPDDAVLHFSGWTGSHESRIQAMMEWLP